MNKIMETLSKTSVINDKLAKQLGVFNKPLDDISKKLISDNRISKLLSTSFPTDGFILPNLAVPKRPEIDTSWIREKKDREVIQASAAEATIESLEVQIANGNVLEQLVTNQLSHSDLMWNQNLSLERILDSQKKSDIKSEKREKRNFIINMVIVVLASVSVCIGIGQTYLTLTVQNKYNQQPINTIRELKDTVSTDNTFDSVNIDDFLPHDVNLYTPMKEKINEAI